MRLLLVGLVAALLAMPSAAVAQDDDLLPAPGALGPGWAVVQEFGPPDDLGTAFLDDRTRVYAGPSGARVVARVFIVAEGMSAARNAWEAANVLEERVRGEMDYGYDARRENEMAEVDPPAGCVATRRIYGSDRFMGEAFPVGLSLCAADAGVELIVAGDGATPATE